MRFVLKISLSIILVTVACGRGQAPQGPQGMGMPPAAVRLAVAQPAEIEDVTEYVSTLKSLRSTTIQPQVAGQIISISVKSGDRVKAGTPLVQIDPQRQQAVVTSQDADITAKEANLTYARQQYQRVDDLYTAKVVSRAELQQAEAAVNTAQAEIESLRAKLQQGQVELRYYGIKAPTDGTVGEIPVRVGNLVTPLTLLMTIEQNDGLEVYVPVPLERAAELRVGLPLRVADASGTLVASTTVSFVSPRVDDQTQSVLVKGLVRNPNGALRTDQFVRASIVWKSSQGLLIPVVAVIRVNGQFFAYVAEEQDKRLVAKQRPLKLGPVIKDDYTVLSGIQPNDRIVVSGIQKLTDGVPITPQT